MNSAEILRAMLTAGWVRVTSQPHLVTIEHSALYSSRGIFSDEGPADFADNIRWLGEDLAYHGL